MLIYFFPSLFQSKEEEDNFSEESVGQKKDADVDESVSNEVSRLWKLAEKQCSCLEKCESNKCQETDLFTDLGWIVIRVFVSSTFNDFFNEREVLVKQVGLSNAFLSYNSIDFLDWTLCF